MIVEAVQNGEIVREVAKRFHVGKSTVSDIYKKWRQEGTVKRKKGSGRPRITTIRQVRALVRQVKKNPFMTAVELARHAQETLNVSMSVWTARRLLVRAGLPARIPAKKSWILKKNRKARVAFAKAHEHWTVHQWARILFSDETKNNLFGSDGIRFVRRPAGKRFDRNYTRPTVKHSASVLPWGMFLFQSLYML